MYKVIAIIVTSTFLLQACSAKDSASYIKKYDAAASTQNLLDIPEKSIENFITLFSDLNSENLEANVELAYASKIYFNDTLNTIEDRKEMLKYLQHTADTLDSYSFNVVDRAQSGDNLYIRWTMDISFTAAGKDITSQSIGMSHLKFNDAGKIVLHQDYWDSVEAIYQHLPYVGYWIKKIRDKL